MPAQALTLSDIAYYARRGVIFGGIGIALFMVGRFFLSYALTVYVALNPPPPPLPTVGFGLLPRPAFLTQAAGARPQTYRLESVGQTFPSFGDQAPVFFMPIAQPSLVALDKARQKAASLGFVFEPEMVSASLYRWRKTTPLPASLEINVVDDTFLMSADWASSPTLLEKKLIPPPQQLTNELRSLLRSSGLTSDDIATASPKLSYVRALGGELRPAASVSEADFVQADIFRVTPTGLPTVTSQKGQGVIQVLFSGSREQGERILHFRSSYYPIQDSTFETYPLISAGQAFQQLQTGGGYISSPATTSEAVVRTAHLAYYEPAVPQNYFQPVYVFEGDDGFQALVPAIDPQYFVSSPGGV